VHPVVEPRFHIGCEADILDLEIRCARVTYDHERRGARAEIRGTEREGVDATAALIHARDARRNLFVGAAEDFADDGSDGRRVVDEAGGGGRKPAGEEALMAAAVVRELVSNGAHEVEAVGDFRVAREQFAHFDAGHVGADRAQRPAIFERRIGLHVVALEVRDPAGQPDENHGLVAKLAPGVFRDGFRTQIVAQAKTEQAQRADLQEAAARDRAAAPLKE
jgi:hypothetical protein